MTQYIQQPEQPRNSFRVTIVMSFRERLDGILLHTLKEQNRNFELRNISRHALKALFKAKRVQIKGQNALPSSMLAVGTTYVDILGFTEKSPAEEISENDAES